MRFCAHIGIRSLAVLLGAMMVGTGCYRALPPTVQPPDDGRVTVMFREPVVVSVQTAAPERVQLPGVTEIRGRVELVTPDTIYVRVKGASGPDLGFRDVPVNGIAAVPRGPDTYFDHREFSPGRTAALGFGLVVGAGLMVLTALVVSMMVHPW